ncbi:MAG: TadE/TadG family type IV pilus assembly protein [Alphaproteobacteria bacterium]
MKKKIKKSDALAILIRRRRSMAKDRRGIAAVEMAFIAPLMIIMLLGLIEAIDVLLVDRKVTTMTNAVADLVSRVREIDPDGLTDVFSASEAIMDPFSGDDATIQIVSIVRGTDNATTVHWSASSSGTAPYASGVAYPKTIPSGVLAVNESVILASVTYQYAGPITDMFVNGFNLEAEYYSKPRRSRTVLLCDDLDLADPSCI